MRLNLAGYLFLWFDGYGRFCSKTTQALLRLGHECYPFDIKTLEKPAWFLQSQGLRFDHVTVQLMPPNQMKPLPGRSIAYSMHESGNLPFGWADKVNTCNQALIVPHPWLIEVFEAGGVEVPISVVKSGIDPDECQVTLPNFNGPFRIGCLADRGGRKGHGEVYSAFYKAFDYRNRDVRLIMKCRPDNMPHLDFSYSSDPRLTVWKADVPNVADIYSQFDLFAFPTKCEGWGQPCRESAACGVPTLVTRWSGVDDETEKWAIPLEHFTFVESGMVGCGGRWAQPDEDELIYWLRWAYDNREVARARALEGAKWLRLNRTYAQAAQNLVATIADIMGGFKPPEVPVLEEYDPLEAERMRDLTLKSLADLPEEISGLEISANGRGKKELVR